MLFLWVKILHHNIFSFHFPAKIVFSWKFSIKICFRKKPLHNHPNLPTHFQVKRWVPNKYSKVFEITFVAKKDENCYRQIGSIGPDAHLKCPDNCYILGYCIYPNGYPVITPYKVTDIIRQPRAIKRARRKFNILPWRRRVFVGN